MLDNYYLLVEQIRTTRQHLPKNYSRELPCLEKGTFAGFPRVYDIALEIISHGDGSVDPEGLSRFVMAYQQVTPLNLGTLDRKNDVEGKSVSVRVALGWCGVIKKKKK